VAAGWHLTGGFSLRAVEERLAERNIDVDRATVNRWVHRLRSRATASRHASRGRADGPCRLEAGHLVLRGETRWLYRVLDPDDHVVDVYLSHDRDDAAARRFFERAGELRVWAMQSAPGEDIDPDAPGNAEAPADAAPVDPVATNGPVSEEAVVGDDGASGLRKRIDPWIRSTPRRVREDDGARPAVPSKVIEAEVVDAPDDSTEEPESPPALSPRMQAWLRVARRTQEK
jgi:hypothetical protein